MGSNLWSWFLVCPHHTCVNASDLRRFRLFSNIKFPCHVGINLLFRQVYNAPLRPPTDMTSRCHGRFSNNTTVGVILSTSATLYILTGYINGTYFLSLDSCRRWGPDNGEHSVPSLSVLWFMYSGNMPLQLKFRTGLSYYVNMCFYWTPADCDATIYVRWSPQSNHIHVSLLTPKTCSLVILFPVRTLNILVWLWKSHE